MKLGIKSKWHLSTVCETSWVVPFQYEHVLISVCLQHGAAVFLYHPCAPVSERVRLSVLAHSCLSNYIITPHYELGANRVSHIQTRTLTLQILKLCLNYIFIQKQS